MTILKSTTTQFIQNKVPYEVFSREVVQSITNPEALAIWAYLMTKPAEWVPRRDEIIEHFDGLGRKRYDDAIKALTALGLYQVVVVRGDDGTFGDRIITVTGEPESPKVGKPTIRLNQHPVNQHPDNPQCGKRDHLKIQRFTKDTEIIKYTEIPGVGFDDFYNNYPNKTGRAAAQKAWKKLKPSLGLVNLMLSDIQERVDKGHWCTGKGKAYIPHPATYLNQARWTDEIIPRPDFKQPQDFSRIAREAQEI